MTSPPNVLPPTVPSPPKGMSSSSSSSQTSASQPMASQPPTGPCRGAPPKKGLPGVQRRVPGQVPSSLALAPSRETDPKSSLNPHLLRKRKPHLRLRRPRWAPVSLGRERKETQTKTVVSKSLFLGSLVHSYNTHCDLRANVWYWVLGPKAGQNSEQVQINEAVIEKVTSLLGRSPSTHCPPLPLRCIQCHLPKAVPADRHFAEQLLYQQPG